MTLARFVNLIRTIWGPPWAWTLTIGGLMLMVLLGRGLDYGPLHTDVIIVRAWFAEYGIDGFSARYWEVNQRHPLVGPLYTAAFRAFGEADLPYNAIFHASRLLSGVMLTGVLAQLGGRPSMAILAGVALAITPVRVVELYQSINWFIEPTLTMLLASSWCYARALTGHAALTTRRRRGWYLASMALYGASILIYESGLPWIAVNMVIGWWLRPALPPLRRALLAIRDMLPPLIGGAILAYLLLFVFVPWTALAPEAGSGLIMRVLRDVGGALAFPGLVIDWAARLWGDGYAPVLVCLALLSTGLGVGCAAAFAPRPHAHAQAPRGEVGGYLYVAAFGLAMIVAAVLVGASAREANLEYLDRINFGRSAGIAVCFTALIYALAAWRRWSEWIASAACGLLLVAPGAATVFRAQDAALASRAVIPALVGAVREVRQVVYLPAHLILLTNQEFPLAVFNNASDAVLHEIQQQLFRANEPATLDLLKMGAFAESYLTAPGTCNNLSREAPAGLCLDRDQIINSRWAANRTSRYEDVVSAYWDGARLTILREVALEALQRCGFNIATAGGGMLRTNPARVAVAIPDLPITSQVLCGR